MSSSIFGQLETALNGYLSDISRQALTSDGHTAAGLATHELPRLAAALRAVLAEHEPDDRGRCRTCRRRPLGRAQTPCRAYLTAHLCLLVNEDDHRRDQNVLDLNADLSADLSADLTAAPTVDDLRQHLGAVG
jgi:hypothetical protein